MTPEGISYTQKEYEYAQEIGLKVLAFIHNAPHLIPIGKSEALPELRERLERFRSSVTNGRLVRYWKLADELPGLVATSLNRTIKTYPATGWIRGNSNSADELLNEINSLRQQNNDLRLKCIAAEKRVEFADAFNDFFYRSIEKNHDEALKLVNQAISLAYTRDDLARCLRNKGYTLGELRRDKEAINVYTQLIEGFGGTESDKIKSELAKARINMGFLLVRNNEYAEAVRIYDQAIDEIRSDNDASLFELLSHAYVNKFELLIVNNEEIGDEDFSDYYSLFRADRRKLMQLDMIRILYFAKHKEQKLELQKWINDYDEFKLVGWDFEVFYQWSLSIDSQIARRRVSYCLDTFKKYVEY